jgi:hypothetical protein
MVQLSILSGKMAGEIQLIRHFPFLIGRSRENHLCLDDAGIWERHLTLGFQKEQGFTLETAAEALATVNPSAQRGHHLDRIRQNSVLAGASAIAPPWLSRSFGVATGGKRGRFPTGFSLLAGQLTPLPNFIEPQIFRQHWR